MKVLEKPRGGVRQVCGILGEIGIPLGAPTQLDEGISEWVEGHARTNA